jgi:hypothetical protein
MPEKKRWSEIPTSKSSTSMTDVFPIQQVKAYNFIIVFGRCKPFQFASPRFCPGIKRPRFSNGRFIPGQTVHREIEVLRHYSVERSITKTQTTTKTQTNVLVFWFFCLLLSFVDVPVSVCLRIHRKTDRV